MKNFIFFLIFSISFSYSQIKPIEFTEFTLNNGLHVILHEDNSTPIVAISVMYNCTLHIPSQKNCNYNLDLDVLWFGTIRGDDPDLSQWKIGRVESEKISKIFDLMEGLMHLHNNKK